MRLLIILFILVALVFATSCSYDSGLHKRNKIKTRSGIEPAQRFDFNKGALN